MLKHVSEDNFGTEVLRNEKPVLVDFFATWCGPCNIVAPILEKIAIERDDFDIAKVDIDQAMSLAGNYSIEVVPTMILINNGHVVGRLEGMMSKSQILDFIVNNL